MSRKPRPIVLLEWGDERTVEDEEFLLALLRQGLLLRRRAAIACFEHASAHRTILDLRLAMAAAVYQQVGFQAEDALTWCVAMRGWVSKRPQLRLADAYGRTNTRALDEKLGEAASQLRDMAADEFLPLYGLPHDQQEFESLTKKAFGPSAVPVGYEELDGCRAYLAKALATPKIVPVLNKIKHGPQLTVERFPADIHYYWGDKTHKEPADFLRVLGKGAQIPKASSSLTCPCILDDLETLEYQVSWIDGIARRLWFLTHWVYITTFESSIPKVEVHIWDAYAFLTNSTEHQLKQF